MKISGLKAFLLAPGLLLISTIQANAESASMVWFGNSYSDAGQIWSNVPKMITGNYGVAKNLTIDSLNPKIYPSCWLSCHELTWPAFTVIDSGHYNYVVAQDNNPAYCYPLNASGSAAEANELTNWADHAKAAGGVLVIEQIWLNTSGNYPQAAQDRVDQWYDSLARATNSILAPCSHAWWIARQAQPGLEYIAPNWNDGAHPGTFGAYLNECSFFAALTGVSPVGLTFKQVTEGSVVTLSDADALFAQQKAWEAYQYFMPANDLTISNFTANPPASLAGVQTSVTFSATVTGTPSVSSVVLDLKPIGGTANTAMTKNGNVYSYTYAIPASVSLGPKTVSLRATNSAGNYKLARIRYYMEKPLKLKEARSSYDNKKVTVDFSEQINKATAENIANYSINNGVTISSATVGPDSNIVVLATSGLLANTTYTLTASNVGDNAGSVIPANSQDTFQYFTGGDGITGTYWQNQNLSGAPVGTRVDSSIDFPFGFQYSALWSNDWIGVRWDGQLQIPYTGTYTFNIRTSHPARMYLNNQLVVDGWAGGDTIFTGNTTVYKGIYPVKMEYASTQGTKFCTLRWSSNTKISKLQTVPHQFFFTGATTAVSRERVHATTHLAGAEYLVKQIDLRGRTISSIKTSSLEKIAVPGAGIYIMEITGIRNGTVVKRSCSVR
jgi:hypothetical protein